MRTGIIYMATNAINGKSYIGQTVSGLESRKSSHYKDAKNKNFYFCRALRKYGRSDWSWTILYTVRERDLNVAEICAIYYYDTYYNGYNSTEGGDINPMKYKEVREKLSTTWKHDPLKGDKA